MTPSHIDTRNPTPGETLEQQDHAQTENHGSSRMEERAPSLTPEPSQGQSQDQSQNPSQGQSHNQSQGHSLDDAMGVRTDNPHLTNTTSSDRAFGQKPDGGSAVTVTPSEEKYFPTAVPELGDTSHEILDLADDPQIIAEGYAEIADEDGDLTGSN